jgi:hypothetical protein
MEQTLGPLYFVKELIGLFDLCSEFLRGIVIEVCLVPYGGGGYQWKEPKMQGGTCLRHFWPGNDSFFGGRVAPPDLGLDRRVCFRPLQCCDN